MVSDAQRVGRPPAALMVAILPHMMSEELSKKYNLVQKAKIVRMNCRGRRVLAFYL